MATLFYIMPTQSLIISTVRLKITFLNYDLSLRVIGHVLFHCTGYIVWLLSPAKK